MAIRNPIILIPARMGSTRLPGKPLANIAGKPMIVHVMERAKDADIGRVVVAADGQEIVEAVKSAGGEAVLTNKNHPSGSDRIYEALQIIDADGVHDCIVNVQGDLPTIDPKSIQTCFEVLQNPLADIGTLGTLIQDECEKTNPNIVKIVGSPISDTHLRALYFTRATAPFNEGPLYHHIGLYAYRRSALEKFVQLRPSTLELREKLEQLRALEANMRIDVALIDTNPLGVDTPEDLKMAQDILKKRTRKTRESEKA